VCTNKLNAEDAVTYLKYLLSNIQSKELFSTIHIDTNKIWTQLLWQDSVNTFLIDEDFMKTNR
jgi:hypothetical protein